MAHQILVALDVRDGDRYARYRRAIAPALDAHQGTFGYDLRVSQALATPDGTAVNRVFTLRFPDRAAKHAFFADPGYLDAHAEHFAQAVGHVTIAAAFDTAR